MDGLFDASTSQRIRCDCGASDDGRRTWRVLRRLSDLSRCPSHGMRLRTAPGGVRVEGRAMALSRIDRSCFSSGTTWTNCGHLGLLASLVHFRVMCAVACRQFFRRRVQSEHSCLLQLDILPERDNVRPAYRNHMVSTHGCRERCRRFASKDGMESTWPEPASRTRSALTPFPLETVASASPFAPARRATAPAAHPGRVISISILAPSWPGKRPQLLHSSKTMSSRNSQCGLSEKP